MSTEHERDGMAERLRPVGLQCHVKVKEDGISFSQGSRNIHRPKVWIWLRLPMLTRRDLQSHVSNTTM